MLTLVWSDLKREKLHFCIATSLISLLVLSKKMNFQKKQTKINFDALIFFGQKTNINSDPRHLPNLLP